MKQITIRVCGWLTLAGLLAACDQTPVAQVQTEENPVRHVVIIGVDGLSIDGVTKAETPVLDRMMSEGAYTLTARGVFPTSSSANWMSMVAGGTPPLHGVTNNGWERDDILVPPVATGLEDIYPTLFGELRRQQPDATIAAVYAWGGFGRLIERSALDYDAGGFSDMQAVDLAARYLQEEMPDLLFLHLDNIDHIGHSLGHKTEPYYQAVTEADAMIGQMLDAAKAAGIMDSTVFIVSSDHGGIGYGHGGESLDELEIPLIVYGAGIEPGYNIQEYVYIQDIAVTAGHLLSMQPHPSWNGKPVLSMLAAHGDLRDKAAVTVQTPLPAPSILPAEYLYEPAGGFFLDSQATLEIVNNVPGAEIRYTLDGSEPDRNSALYEGPVTLELSAAVKARAYSGDRSSQSATGYYLLAKSDAGQGVSYTYYEGDGWSFLPVFDALEPVSSGQTYQFRIGDINQTERYFGIVYEAWIDIEEAGEHKFYTYSDDGSKLFINGQEVVNNDGSHGTIARSGTITLEPGRHEIRVEYFNEAGGYWLEVLHKAPGKSRALIMPEVLSPRHGE